MKLRILMASLMFGVAALGADNGAELFQKAVTQERAAGNLEEAIKLYQRVAKEFASDRPLAAKALVQEAKCYEKLGQDKAVKIYEQVARDFGDQREMAEAASARLAVLRKSENAPPAAATLRMIDLPGSSMFETDGRRTVYLDDETGALMIGDLSRRDKRTIFKPKNGEELTSFVPSRDLSMVELFLTRPDGSHQFASIGSDGAGYREIRGDDSCEPTWSWDSRDLLVCERQPDKTVQLRRITVADGKASRVQTDYYGQPHLSPDGRFIASSDEGRRYVGGRVFVTPSQGGEPQLVSDTAILVDWTRDGRYLAILRLGVLSVIPMKDGRKAGDPVFVRSGAFLSGRIYANGTFGLASIPQDGPFATWLGTLSPDGRSGGWKRLHLSGGSSSRALQWITWSPDSSQIAYVGEYAANQAGQNTRAVRLRNIATGEERELYQDHSQFSMCLWRTQHPNLFCERSTAPAVDLFSIAIDSGRVEQLGSLPLLPIAKVLLYASRDGTAIYILSNVGHELIRWDVGARQATTVERSPGLTAGGTAISPDGRWITRRVRGIVEIRPMSGGDWRPVGTTGAYSQVVFTPDGNWLLYYAVDAAGKPSLLRVATAGGRPERVGDFPVVTRNTYISISPDGQQIIAQPANPLEIAVLENFEPR